MIINFESGQLGNQLFQYCALKRYQPESALYLIGMQSLKSTFIGVEVAGGTVLDLLIERFIRRLGINRLDTLARKLQLIGLIEEYRTVTGSEFKVNNGLLRNVYYCDTSYFQSENMVDPSVTDKLELRPELLEYASNICINFPHDRTETFFVHVRRGDYTYWPSRISPAVLPLRWYLKQMELIRSNYAKPFFVVVSDDVPYATEMFFSYSDVFVSNESKEVDFALMTQCDGGGILSASSFAWWGAYFARRINSSALFIAPLHWAGHREGRWIPEGIETSWLKYILVN